MRSRILSLWLPQLPIDRLLRSARRAAGPETRPETGTGARPDPIAAMAPLATFVEERGALRLATVCPRARQAGLGPGLMLADARARLPELQVEAAAPEADARLLAEIAIWCQRYTPLVAIDRSHASPGGALWLDITGCAHLFGGEMALRTDLLTRLGRQGFTAQAAIADHPGTAWAIARHGPPDRQIVPPKGAAVALAGLPVTALRLPAETVAMLARLGLERIEQLRPLPRQALAARFGTALLTRLEQAQGLAAEPISPDQPRPAHRVEQAFVEPILTGEALGPLTHRLLAQLTAGLEQASLGARQLSLACYRVDDSTGCITIGTSRPCRDRRQLFRLLAEKLDRLDPGFGIERLILEAPVVEPLLPEPLAWRAMGAGDLDQVRDLAPLVDRLSNRLGARAVTRLQPHASHLPERAQRRVPAADHARPVPFVARKTHGQAPSRPLRLLARPEPIEAMAPLPDEPPLRFRWRRILHEVVHASGPERLAPEWWRTSDHDPPDRNLDATTRDYYAVEDHQGGRFWLFREGLYLDGTPTLPRWFLHGLFA